MRGQPEQGYWLGGECSRRMGQIEHLEIPKAINEPRGPTAHIKRQTPQHLLLRLRRSPSQLDQICHPSAASPLPQTQSFSPRTGQRITTDGRSGRPEQVAALASPDTNLLSNSLPLLHHGDFSG